MRPIAIGALFIFTGLLLIFVFARSRRLRKREKREHLARNMRQAAQIAQAAAMEGYHITLDETDESIASLERIVRQLPKAEIDAPSGEIDVQSAEPPDDSDAATIVIDDSIFVTGAYLGMIASLRHNGTWHDADEFHRLPWLYFESANLELEPFLLIERQQNEPNFSLDSEYQRFLQHLEIAMTAEAATQVAKEENG